MVKQPCMFRVAEAIVAFVCFMAIKPYLGVKRKEVIMLTNLKNSFFLSFPKENFQKRWPLIVGSSFVGISSMLWIIFAYNKNYINHPQFMICWFSVIFGNMFLTGYLREKIYTAGYDWWPFYVSDKAKSGV